MKYILIIFFAFILLSPVQAFAAERGDLTTCDTKGFCAKDGTTWVRKVSCRPGTEFKEIKERCDSMSMDGLDCRTTSDPICICNFEELKNSCGTQGGINDASSGNFEKVFGRVNPPAQIGSLGNGSGAISNVIQRVIQLMYTIAGVGFVIFFLWNALQLIISGGDKEKVAGARKHITWSIIGITLMALAFPILRVIESIIGIKFFF